MMLETINPEKCTYHVSVFRLEISDSRRLFVKFVVNIFLAPITVCNAFNMLDGAGSRLQKNFRIAIAVSLLYGFAISYVIGMPTQLFCDLQHVNFEQFTTVILIILRK